MVESCRGNLSRPALAAALAQLAQAVSAVAAALQDPTAPAVSLLSPACHGPTPQLASLPAPTPQLASGAAVNEFLIAKAKGQRSMRYLRALRVSLGSFLRGRERVPLDGITLADVEAWLAAPHWRARTRRGYLLDVRTFFNWARRRGLCVGNPAALVELPESPPRPPAIHSPEQVATVLETARELDRHTCRLLAIRYFAGVRSAEAHRMTEADLKLESGFVEVPAAKSKTRARRLVPVTPALRAWLGVGGSLPVTNIERVTAIVKASGVPWPSNVTRHSFCSYRLADVRSAAQVALEAGHSEGMLFRHYRETVSPADAKAFWEIRPK